MITIRQEAPTPATLDAYATVPIAFLVTSRFRVQPLVGDSGLGGWTLTEEPVARAYVKDYDALEGEGPRRWAAHFDLSRWGIFSVFYGNRRVGGAAIAFNAPDVHMLEGRSDLAVLWDIRIHPDVRRTRIGARLFAEVMTWASDRGCKHLKIETQNINVPACKFYARMGCELRAIHPDAYPDLPDEVQLLWYRRL